MNKHLKHAEVVATGAAGIFTSSHAGRLAVTGAPGGGPGNECNMENDMSTITIVNDADDIPPIGLFQKAYNIPKFIVPWKIVRPTQGGRCKITIPVLYDVFVQSGDEDDPNGGCRSNVVPLTDFTANLVLQAGAATDNSAACPHLSFSNDPPVQNQINIENATLAGVWAHVMSEGTDILPTQVLTGQSTIMYDVRQTYFVAVVNTFVQEGQRIREEELTTRPVPILIGGTATVAGNRWSTYTLTVPNGGS